MTPFTILILVCSMTIDHAACQPRTAVDVIRGPHVASEIECGNVGMTILAAGALAPRPGHEYMKIVCRHVPG